MKKLAVHASSAVLAGALALASAAAWAGPTEDAKVFFNVGAQAYEKGDFPAALSAFQQAYRLSPRPGILFSIAQANRKQFYTGGKHPEHLRAAIAAYKEYLVKVEQGGRRSDAAEALAELEAIAAKMDMGSVAAGAVVPPPAAVTKIMVTSQTAEALISLDGGKPQEVPLVADVKPGKHSVRITASGFFDETRDVDVAAGAVAPLDVTLKEKPGKLAIVTREGASVSIDGRFAAATPLAQPLDVEPGHHLVTVTKNGYRAFSQEIEIGRAEQRSLDVPLDATVQRNASFVLIAAGAAALVAGGTLAVIAVEKQHDAQTFDDQRKAGKFSCDTQMACDALNATYQQSLGARDDFRRDAGIVLGAGVLVGAVGVALFAFDFPSLLGVTPRDKAKEPAKPAPRERSMEMSAAPMVGPGLYGGSLRVRF